MKPLLIVKTGQTLPALRASGEDFEDWIMRGMAIDSSRILLVNVYADEALPDLASIAGMIVTGSPAMVTDLAPWSERCAEYMRDAVALAVPVLGICYGHQLLAHACGGAVGYHPQGREIGTVVIENKLAAQQDSLFGAMPERFLGHTTHSQSVMRLPLEAVLLATSAHDAHQAFRIGDNAWGVQFHPEFDAQIMRGYVGERRADLLAEGYDIDRLIEGVFETPEATHLLREFALLTGVT
jgi:GMP synthase (glutamine-hydrolysing)